MKRPSESIDGSSDSESEENATIVTEVSFNMNKLDNIGWKVWMWLNKKIGILYFYEIIRNEVIVGSKNFIYFLKYILVFQALRLIFVLHLKKCNFLFF